MSVDAATQALRTLTPPARTASPVADGTEKELTAKERGMRVELTLRGEGPATSVAERAESLLRGLPLVSEVRVLEPSEPGEGIASLSVASDGDVRDVVCRTLIENNFGLLELSRSERELESAFLELLAGNSSRRAGARSEVASGAEAKEKVS